MHRISILLASLCCVALVGCGNDATVSYQYQVTGTPISGKLQSGTAPVSGAHVYLLAVAATGYGQPSVSLLDPGSTGGQDSVGAYVTTAADGSFTIPGFYSCGNTTEVYLYTRGGDSGLGNNSVASELAAIGSCSQLGDTVAPVVVNEVTTVAMSFALAGFAEDALHVASSGTPLALTGVGNAFVNASNLAPVTTGVAPALIPSGSAAVPQTTINTLANILSACIHSTGAASPPCQALLGSAGGGTAYSDTASAMIGIAHSPGDAVSTLFAQQSGNPPFAPYLAAAPNDWSLGLIFIGGGIDETTAMAVDAVGDVWSTSLNSTAVTEISNAGVFLSGASGYPFGGYAAGPVAIDVNGNAWIGSGAHTFSGPGRIIELSSSGTILSGPNGYTGDGIETPQGLAIDANGNLWVADTMKNNIVELSNSGTVLSGTAGFTGGGVNNPGQLSIDASGNIWAANFTNLSLTELSNAGSPLTPATGITGPGYLFAYSLAIDHQGDVWTIAEQVTGPALISKLSPSGTLLSGAGYPAGFDGGNQDGTTIAIDGDGNAWFPLYSTQSVGELSNTGTLLSGSDGYGGGVAGAPGNIVLDGSGDVWVSSATFTPSGVRGVPGVTVWRITELIGVAAPVVTPLAAGVQHNMLGIRP